MVITCLQGLVEIVLKNLFSYEKKEQRWLDFKDNRESDIRSISCAISYTGVF